MLFHSPCSYGWTHSNHTQKCYKYIEAKTEWIDATKTCKSDSSNPTVNLASVPDKTTNDFLMGLTSKNAWLGGFQKYYRSWLWSDESQWTGYENWGVGQPSNNYDKKYLMFNLYTHGTWSNQKNAKYAEGSLCQYDPEPCAPDWSFSENTNLCYKFVNILTNWNDAINTCKSSIENPSANLASIPDKSTNDFLARLATTVSSWIGASKNSDGDWAWSDGSGWNYTNWGSGEPSSGNATLFNWPGSFLGKWKTQMSNDYLAPVLCQYDLREKTTTTCTATPATTCSTISDQTLCTTISEGVCSITQKLQGTKLQIKLKYLICN